MDKPYEVGPEIGGSKSEPIDLGLVKKVRVKGKDLGNGIQRIYFPDENKPTP